MGDLFSQDGPHFFEKVVLQECVQGCDCDGVALPFLRRDQLVVTAIDSLVAHELDVLPEVEHFFAILLLQIYAAASPMSGLMAL